MAQPATVDKCICVAMVRSAADASSPTKPPAQLSISGVHCDTTRETSEGPSNRMAQLAGQVGLVADEKGRLSVDRNGKLVGQMLQLIRNSVRPSNEILVNYTGVLAAVCEHVEFDWVHCELRGDVFQAASDLWINYSFVLGRIIASHVCYAAYS